MADPLRLACRQITLSILCGSKGCQKWTLLYDKNAPSANQLSIRSGSPSHKPQHTRQPQKKPYDSHA